MFEKILDLVDGAVKVGTFILAIMIYNRSKDKGE
jgi:hypothetical protein